MQGIKDIPFEFFNGIGLAILMILLLLLLVPLTCNQGSASLIRIENCYSDDLKANIDCNRNIICFKLIPLGKYECSILPDTVLFTVNISSYSSSLQKILTNFRYTETTTLCIKCPTTDTSTYLLCKSALKQASAISLSISSETHQIVLPARSLVSTNLNLTECYTRNSTAYVDIQTDGTRVCARVEPTGSCSILDDSSVGQYVSSFLYISSNGKTFNYQLDSTFSAASTLVCSRKTINMERDLLAALLADEWSSGQFVLNYNIEKHLYKSTTRLFTVMTSQYSSCLGSTDIRVYPTHINVFVQGNIHSGDSGNNCDVDSLEFSVIELTVYIYDQKNESIRFKNYVPVRYYNTSQSYQIIIPCENVSLCTDAYNTLLNGDINSNMYTGGYSIRYITSSGSLSRVITGYVKSVVAPCWVDSGVFVYNDHFSVFLIPSGAKNCPISKKLLNYTITAHINNVQKGNPTWKDQRVIATFQMKMEFSIDRTLISFYCTKETFSSKQMSIKDCTNLVTQLYKNRDSRSLEMSFVGRDLYLNEVANVHTVITDFRNSNYQYTNMIIISIVAGISFIYLTIVIILFYLSMRNMRILMKAMEERF